MVCRGACDRSTGRDTAGGSAERGPGAAQVVGGDHQPNAAEGGVGEVDVDMGRGDRDAGPAWAAAGWSATWGPVGQSQLDRPVQLLDDIAERPGNLKDHHLTHCVRPDLLRAFGQALRPLGRDLVGAAGATSCQGVVRLLLWLCHVGERPELTHGIRPTTPRESGSRCPMTAGQWHCEGRRTRRSVAYLSKEVYHDPPTPGSSPFGHRIDRRL